MIRCCGTLSQTIGRGSLSFSMATPWVLSCPLTMSLLNISMTGMSISTTIDFFKFELNLNLFFFFPSVVIIYFHATMQEPS